MMQKYNESYSPKNKLIHNIITTSLGFRKYFYRLEVFDILVGSCIYIDRLFCDRYKTLVVENGRIREIQSKHYIVDIHDPDVFIKLNRFIRG